MGQYLVNGEVVEMQQDHPTAADLVRTMGRPSKDWVMAAMPDGQVRQLQDNEELPTNAEHLSVVVPHKYGAPDLSARSLRKSRLAHEVLLIASRYGNARFDRLDGSWVYVSNFPLPRGWNQRQVEILIEIPCVGRGYPSVPPQWFWTDHDLRTSDGRAISHFFTEGAAGNTGDRSFIEKGWGHFCVHLEDHAWNPVGGERLEEGHSLLSYLEVIENIFRDRRTLAGR